MSDDYADVSDNSRSNSPLSSHIQEMSIDSSSNMSTQSTPQVRVPKATKSTARKSTASASHSHSSSNISSEASKNKKKHSLERELRLIHTKEDHTSNFMLDFDPSKSRREKTRNNRKVDYSEATKNNRNKKQSSFYNDKGVHRTSGTDFCDCLLSECPGCHFPCPKCKSTKCGFECRQNRKWQVEFIANEDNTIDKRINNYAVQTMKK